MNEQWYEIWMEGYAATGQSSQAHRVGSYPGTDFYDACKAAARDKQWASYYNPQQNTYWGCRLFNDEAAARKSFG